MDVLAERAYHTPVANSSLLPWLLLSLASQKHTPDTSSNFNDVYDYIIVGAGSAGATLAGRLSEEPCVRVLLLEAGKPPPRLTEVPVFASSFYNSDIDWQYWTTPQRNTGNGLLNRKVSWPSGKTLGGSSVLNAMMSVRGNKKNYDDWANAGATGWSYWEVLPYFKKLEQNLDPEFVANGYHGTDGPVTIKQPQYISEIKGPLVEAVAELGYRFVDSTGPTQTGFYDHQASMRGGQRCSTAKAYLVPAEYRPNLDVVPKAMVTKVLFRGTTAEGVQFDHQGAAHVVRARREVILSAGAVNSAQLLMLSGVGPRRELQKFGIPVVADLPVGQNFQDHVGAFLAFELDDSIQPIAEKLSDPVNIKTYMANRTGPLTSTEGVSLQAFLNNYGSEPDIDFPDHQIYFMEGWTKMAKLLGITSEIEEYYSPYEERSFMWCISENLHPKSRGTVRLLSADPYDPPLIDPNYFANQQDLEDVVQGMKACHRVASARAMRKIGVKPFPRLLPGCEQYRETDDEYLRCQARSYVMSMSHPAGSVKMGDPYDDTTVVDPQLRVKGLSGLRVVDASVMPTLVSGNPNVPTIMIAEKAADLIKLSIYC